MKVVLVERPHQIALIRRTYSQLRGLREALSKFLSNRKACLLQRCHKLSWPDWSCTSIENVITSQINTVKCLWRFYEYPIEAKPEKKNCTLRVTRGKYVSFNILGILSKHFLPSVVHKCLTERGMKINTTPQALVTHSNKKKLYYLLLPLELSFVCGVCVTFKVYLVNPIVIFTVYISHTLLQIDNATWTHTEYTYILGKLTKFIDHYYRTV